MHSEKSNAAVDSGKPGISMLRPIALSLAAVSILAFALLARYLYQAETASIQNDFSTVVAQQANSFEREVLLNLEILFALNASVKVMDDVDPADFERLTHDILSRSPAIRAISWAEVVPGSTLREFEARQREWYPDYQVTERGTAGEVQPVTGRPRYIPVLMIEPLATNRAALGFDLASEPQRLAALLQASETGRMVATAGVTLIQEPGSQRGFLVFSSLTLPATENSAAFSDERTVFLNGVFRVGELVNQSVGSLLDDRMQVRVVDRTGNGSEVLYSRRPDSSDSWLTEQRVIHRLHNGAGRQWSYEVVPAESLFAGKRSPVPWLVFGSGSVVVVLLVIYVLVTHRKTRALNDAKAQLEKISLTDSLTGLANRRYFDQHLELQWAQAAREGKPMSLIMIDIDNFKSYNDEYGHPEGDTALEGVARALRSVAIRPMDLIARYGGEEFALILPNTEDPVQVAQACRRAVAALELPHEHSDAASIVTISAGVCTLQPAENYSYEQLIEWADEALYQAKEGGRNRVDVYSP